MKKIFILVSSLLLLLVLIPSVYADDAYYDVDYALQFAGDTTAGIPSINGVGAMGDGWTLVYESIASPTRYAILSPKVLIPAGAILQEIRIPNYAIYHNGNTQTNTFSNMELRVFNVGNSSVTETTTLQNFGPGGKSYFRLPTPRTWSVDKEIQFKIVMSETVAAQLHNNTHSDLTPGVYGGSQYQQQFWYYFVESYFFESVRRSFNKQWVDARTWINETNYYANVTVRFITEFNPPDPGDFDSVDDLPATRGSLFTNKLDMGRVYFELDGYSLTALVRYDVNNNGSISADEEWYLHYNLDPSTDLSIFSNNYETFYYQYENEKFFVINHGTQSMFFYNNIRNTDFIPYTVWNLTTDEIRSVNKMRVYLYSVVENEKQVYVYFYADDFVIDNLLAATVTMEYRFRYHIELYGPGPWLPYINVLEKDVLAFAGVPWWQRFLTLGVVGLAFPELYTQSSLPTLLAGSIANGFFSGADPRLVFNTINQIEHITPNSSLLYALTNSYQSMGLSGSITGNVYKLYLGYFDQSFTKGVEINPEFNAIGNQKGINIMEMTYETEGQIHTITGDEIDVSLDRGPGTDTQPDIDLSNANVDLASIVAIIGGAAIAVLIFIIAITQGSFISKYKGFNFGALFGTLIGSVIAGAFVGVLLWFLIEWLFTGGFISLTVALRL